jgi:hypothetical protein
VLLETLSGAAFLADQVDLACYTRAFTMLRACALTAEQTLRLLDENRTPPWE